MYFDGYPETWRIVTMDVPAPDIAAKGKQVRKRLKKRNNRGSDQGSNDK